MVPLPATTYVLVHGSHTNAAAWGPVARELTLRGHRAVALDLPGHGFDGRPPLAWLGSQDRTGLAVEPSDMAARTSRGEIDAVVAVLRRVREHGPVVLVGHSRGGLAVTGATNEAPELLDHVVYVSAWCPVAATVAEYATASENADNLLGPVGAAIALADPWTLGAIRLNWRTADPAALDVLQAAVLADGTRAELLAYLQTQDADESLAIDDDLVRVDPARWGRVAHTYVRVTDDRALPVALQDRFVREADAAIPDNPFAVASLASSHLAVQIHPDPLVDVLEQVAVSPSAAR